MGLVPCGPGTARGRGPVYWCYFAPVSGAFTRARAVLSRATPPRAMLTFVLGRSMQPKPKTLER
jgi:hypothetical protein